MLYHGLSQLGRMVASEFRRYVGSVPTVLLLQWVRTRALDRAAGREVTRSKDANDRSEYRLDTVKTAGERARPTKHRHQEDPSRFPTLDLRQLREMWYKLYKTAAAPQLSRGLLMRAVACRIQELASGGLRPEVQHQLHQIASELQQTGRVTIRVRPRLA